MAYNVHPREDKSRPTMSTRERTRAGLQCPPERGQEQAYNVHPREDKSRPTISTRERTRAGLQDPPERGQEQAYNLHPREEKSRPTISTRKTRVYCIFHREEKYHVTGL